MIEIKNLSKVYENGYEALKDIDLQIPDGALVTLLGPSGCGKSTILNIIAGILDPSGGDILFDGKSIIRKHPKDRDIGMVFQNYALYPHMSVLENITFPLTVGDNKISQKEANKVAEKYMDLTYIKEYKDKKPAQLSGGQQQRVAIARALVNEPEIILFDEPLGALDLKLRKRMQVELKNIQKEVETTFIYVTHDQEEALSMSDKIAVMNNGIIEQYGTPQYIYEEPVNAFVANFLGDSNIFKGKMVDRSKVRFLGHDFPCVDKVMPGKDVSVMLRPEYLYLSGDAKLKGIVENTMFKGTYYNIKVSGEDFSINVHNPENIEIGSKVCVAIDPDAIHVMEEPSTKPGPYDNSLIGDPS